jgi:hypothetical protein
MESHDLASPDRKTVAVSEMTASIQRGESRKFFVGLVGYYVEGYPYPSSGLSVDIVGISDIELTDRGFQCQAMFAPEQLRPEIVSAKGIVEVTVRGNVYRVVPVHLEARFEDIWSVVETTGQEQIELYKDLELMLASVTRFNTKWMESDSGPEDT